MESYCSLCTFKVPQGANNLILCTLDTIHRLLLIINLVTKKSLCIVSKVQSIKLFALCGTLKVQREQ